MKLDDLKYKCWGFVSLAVSLAALGTAWQLVTEGVPAGLGDLWGAAVGIGDSTVLPPWNSVMDHPQSLSMDTNQMKLSRLNN